MNIEFDISNNFYELCCMKSALLLLLAISMFFITSCSSEYSERLLKAKVLRFELLRMQQNNNIPKYLQADQIEDLQREIDFHAKVSGNAELFKSQLEKE